MGADDRIKVLEDEFKLIKSEVKQTLTSVRDFLLELKLPPLQEEVAPPENKLAELAAEMAPAPVFPAPSAPQPPTPPPGSALAQAQGAAEARSQGQAPAEVKPPEPAPRPVQPEPVVSTPPMANPQGSKPEFQVMPDFNPNRFSPFPESGPAMPAMPVFTSPPPPPVPELLPDIDDEDTGISAGDMPEDIETGSTEEKSPEEDTGIMAGEMPEDEEPEMEDKQPNTAGVVETMKEETSLTTPQVNLLSNLIHWAAKARKEIGVEQLPFFLDIYATTGDLSPETKEVILRLAEVTADQASGSGTPNRSFPVKEEIILCLELNSLDGQLPAELKEKIHRLTEIILRQATNASKADIWSQLLLELHGILTGGGTSLHAIAAAGETGTLQDKKEGEPGEEKKAEKTEAKATEEEASRNVLPARLRLVLPFGNGSEQEVDLGSLFLAGSSSAKQGNGHK
jgi:hypothetical protein